MRPLINRIAIALILAVALVLPVGQTAAATQVDTPQLSLPGLDGTNLNLDNWRDRVVVLVFWATWCAPCIAEVPGLVTLEERYAPRGISIVSVGIDEAIKLRNVVRTLEINYPVMVADPDNARSLLKQWGNRSGVIPYTVIIDRGGRVHTTHRGPIQREDLEALFRPLLDATSSKQANR